MHYVTFVGTGFQHDGVQFLLGLSCLKFFVICLVCCSFFKQGENKMYSKFSTRRSNQINCYHGMYVPFQTRLEACFLECVLASFTLFSSSDECTLVQFEVLCLTRVFKGADFVLEFKYVVCLASFSSNHFVPHNMVHFGGSVGVCFRSTKQENFPVTRFQRTLPLALREQNTYCN